MLAPAPHALGSAPHKLIGLLIGGGHGRRAGGPKALRAVDADLWWRLQARAMLDGGCDDVVAVLHPDAWTPTHRAIAPPANTPGVTCVCADPDAPMFASVQLGLRAIIEACGVSTDAVEFHVALLPVDCPMPGSDGPRASVLQALRDAVPTAASAEATSQPWLIARPWVQTTNGPRFGHPLLLSAQATEALVACDAETTRLDHWIAGLAATRRLDVAVTVEGILANHNHRNDGGGAAGPEASATDAPAGRAQSSK